ncbi:hypothetical protein, partial [Frankia sp. AgKG'84/4]|uniref:hypothetical protein n=1 Tax=Frankia sp. AgKG'84/4 TaxID=573490 RepID=UPI002029F66C
MQTLGAVIVAFALMLIPLIIVGAALTWVYLRCAPLRAANARQGAQVGHGHHPAAAAAGTVPAPDPAIPDMSGRGLRQDEGHEQHRRAALRHGRRPGGAAAA